MLNPILRIHPLSIKRVHPNLSVKGCPIADNKVDSEKSHAQREHHAFKNQAATDAFSCMMIIEIHVAFHIQTVIRQKY